MNINIKSFDHIIDSLEEGLYLTTLDREITYWSKSAERITGFSAEEVVGSRCSDNILVHVDKDGNSLCCGLCPLAQTMKDELPRSSEVYLHHKDGHRVPVSIRVNTLIDSSGEIVGGVELFTDISTTEENAKKISRLESLAMIDDLTKLVNRSYINEEMIKRYEVFKKMQITFGLIFIDIDHFKHINDSLGHNIGDLVLKMVAKNFSTTARPLDVFGRWGGEEFLGIIPNVNNESLQEIAERIRVLVEHSFIMVDGNKVSVTVSIGSTIIQKSDNIDSAVERADKLMYESKRTGRNRVTIG